MVSLAVRAQLFLHTNQLQIGSKTVTVEFLLLLCAGGSFKEVVVGRGEQLKLPHPLFLHKQKCLQLVCKGSFRLKINFVKWFTTFSPLFSCLGDLKISFPYPNHILSLPAPLRLVMKSQCATDMWLKPSLSPVSSTHDFQLKTQNSRYQLAAVLWKNWVQCLVLELLWKW